MTLVRENTVDDPAAVALRDWTELAVAPKMLPWPTYAKFIPDDQGRNVPE